MLVLVGFILGVLGWALLLTGIAGSGAASSLQLLHLGLGLALSQVGVAAMATGLVLRALDARVHDNFEKLFVLLAEVPASRRALDLFHPAPPESQSLRILHRRGAVA